MKQLNVFCEGQTEQGFCAQVLQPHLFPQGDGVVHALAVGEKNNRHVFGIGRASKFERVRKFILNTVKQRAGRNVCFTTLFDLYALPISFPGAEVNVRNAANPHLYADALEEAFKVDIAGHHFIPHLQLHEYETILFAGPEAFAIAFEDCVVEIEQLKEIVRSVPSIEHINDGRESAPSKRIIRVIPEYDGRKTSAGPDIAEYIGLQKIRSKCPHFHQWISQLETLPWEQDCQLAEPSSK